MQLPVRVTGIQALYKENVPYIGPFREKWKMSTSDIHKKSGLRQVQWKDLECQDVFCTFLDSWLEIWGEVRVCEVILLMLQKSGVQQLGLVVYPVPMIHRVSYFLTSQMVLMVMNHFLILTLKKKTSGKKKKRKLRFFAQIKGATPSKKQKSFKDEFSL